MDTWTVAKWMSESVKTVFNAVTTGPSDAVRFGDKTYKDEPWGDCNTKHQIQAFRTIADKSGKKSHALTDQIIIDFRGRDTNDCIWEGITEGWDCGYNTLYSHKHKVSIEIFHEDDTNPVYSFDIAGIDDGNGWVSSQPYLIKKPGKWTVKTKKLQTGDCGDDLGNKSWKELGSFTAKEPLEDCYFQGREEGANVGDCGDCLTGYTEVDGVCTADASGDGAGGSSGSSTDNSQLYMIGGGLLLLLLIIKKKRAKAE